MIAFATKSTASLEIDVLGELSKSFSLENLNKDQRLSNLSGLYGGRTFVSPYLNEPAIQI